MATAPPTRAEWAETQLRRAILHGELAPGERLRAEHLARDLGVSPTPLRETFMRLAGEGLVVLEPQRGARVADLDVDEAAQMYEVRLLLDPVALAQSIEAARASGELARYGAEVTAAHDALVEVSVDGQASAIYDAHRAFHVALVARCSNHWLLRQVIQLLDQSQRFQAIGLTTARRTDPVAEHRALCLAAVAGDAAGAAEVLRVHLVATLESVRIAANSIDI
jgi:DNA-binding GntR family transcriptional regulator